MDEKTQITVLFIVTLLIELTAVFAIGAIPPNEPDFNGAVVVDSYEAIWYENGTLVEKLEYNVSSYGCLMLYRYWGDPLLPAADNEIDHTIPVIELTGMKIPNGTIGFAHYYNGKVGFFEDKGLNYRTFVSSRANDNEVGICLPGSHSIIPGEFSPGNYTVEFYYKFYPSIEYDDQAAHLNMMFAREHNLPYRNVKIILLSDSITNVFTRPPGYHVTEETNKVVITGRSPRGEMISVDFIMDSKSSENIPGDREYVTDIIQKTEFSNNIYQLSLSKAGIILDLAKYAVMIIPFLFVFLYVIIGREKKYYVPKYLSYIPNRNLSPWVVNLIFNGDTFVSDKNGFYATLIDLHRKGFITIKRKISNGGFLIYVHNKKSEDPYEQEVIDFILKYSFNQGHLDTAYFEELLFNDKFSKADAIIELAMKEHLDTLTRKTNPAISQKYAWNGRLFLIPFLIAGIILITLSLVMFTLSSDLAQEYILSAILGMVIIIQSFTALLFPSQLFGRWKDDYYKEKMEWDSFKKTLSDMSQIKKYGPSDFDYWNEWMVYGTALGEGKNVSSVLSEIDIYWDVIYDFEYYWNKIIKRINEILPPSKKK